MKLLGGMAYDAAKSDVGRVSLGLEVLVSGGIGGVLLILLRAMKVQLRD
jgi:hypothetical protein